MVFGVPINGLIIMYLCQKPLAQKTAFDLIIVDNILSAIVTCLAFSIALILGLLTPIPSSLASVISILGYLNFHFFLVSCTVTIITKYLFMIKSEWMLDFSDLQIRISSLAFKTVMTIAFVWIDQIGPFHGKIVINIILDLQMDGLLVTGLGLLISLITMTVSTVLVQALAKSLNANDGVKGTYRILAAFGLVYCALIISLLLTTFIFPEDLSIFIYVLFMFEIIAIQLGMPLVIIHRHDQLFKFISEQSAKFIGSSSNVDVSSA